MYKLLIFVILAFLFPQPRSFTVSPGWELVCKEGWAPKNWCFWTAVLDKILESPLDSREIKPVNPKGNQSWYSLEGLMLKLKLQYFGHLMRGGDLLENTLVLGKTGQKEKGTTEDKMVGWHHQLDGHEFEQALGIGDGQESLPCFSP